MSYKLEIHSRYPIDIEFLEQSMFGKQSIIDEVVDKLENPKTYNDLRLIAECCHYKSGWAFYEAKKLGFDTPTPYKKRLNRKTSYCPEWDEYWS